MTNPCEECSNRNVTCIVEQLFLDCEPWNRFEQDMLNKLLDGSILAVPKPKEGRWEKWSINI